MDKVEIPRKDRRGMRWRLLTARWRVLPEFIVIGMMRSGTTTMFEQICAHPGVTPPRIKGIHYFTNRPRYPMRWYRANFPLRGLSGESSASMLFHEHVPGMIAERLGPRRFVAILRDPVERAISHHRMLVRHRPDKMPLADLLARADTLPMRTGAILPVGRYEQHLPRWYERFGDAVLVVLHEDYRADPQAVMDRVYAHIGLPPHRVDTEVWHHRSPPTDAYDALRPALAAYYAPTRAWLSQQLGRELPWLQG